VQRRLLTHCQGKRVGSFIYPATRRRPRRLLRHHRHRRLGHATSLTTNIAIAESGGSVNITSGTMSATGTNSHQAADHGQRTGGNIIANIIARSTSNQYYACVTPTGSHRAGLQRVRHYAAG
jgi:type IV pilus assembly protein PilY1